MTLLHEATVGAATALAEQNARFEVPEPGLVALFGLGLFALATHARRRMQSKKHDRLVPPAAPEHL